MATQEANQPKPDQIFVKWLPCGAEEHPAFSGCQLVKSEFGFAYYELGYPLHLKHMCRGAKSQKAWADDKVRHLGSWGAEGIIRWK